MINLTIYIYILEYCYDNDIDIIIPDNVVGWLAYKLKENELNIKHLEVFYKYCDDILDKLQERTYILDITTYTNLLTIAKKYNKYEELLLIFKVYNYIIAHREEVYISILGNLPEFNRFENIFSDFRKLPHLLNKNFVYGFYNKYNIVEIF